MEDQEGWLFGGLLRSEDKNKGRIERGKELKLSPRGARRGGRARPLYEAAPFGVEGNAESWEATEREMRG